MRAFVWLLVLGVPLVAGAGLELQYEPAVVQVTGTIAKGRHEHPNGTWFDVVILKLGEPASIKGEDGKDAINVTEAGVREIQVFSKDEAVLKRLGEMNGKQATVSGTIFHAHTAWHVRDLVMMVTVVR